MPVAHSDPRLEGIREQYERARLFLREAFESRNETDGFRRLIAALYFGGAIVEIMLEAADMEVVKVSREELETRLIARLPGYSLIEIVRIHDFHRFGVLPRPGIFLGGMVMLRGQGGHVVLTFDDDGPKVSTSGQSKVIQQRALHMAGDRVYDEESGEYVTMDSLLTRFLGAVPDVISEFKSL